MEGKNKFIDRPKTNSEIRATEGPLLETEIPKRNVDAFASDYEKIGFKKDKVDGVWKKVTGRRFDLNELLEGDVKPEDKMVDSIVKENPVVDKNTTVSDFTGFDKKSNKKAPVLVELYNDRQEKRQNDRKVEIDK